MGCFGRWALSFVVDDAGKVIEGQRADGEGRVGGSLFSTRRIRIQQRKNTHIFSCDNSLFAYQYVSCSRITRIELQGFV